MTGLPCSAYLLLGAPAAALALGFFALRGRRPEWTHLPVLASCAVVTGAAWWLAWTVYSTGAGWDEPVYRWLSAGSFAVDAGLRVDGVGAAMLAMVTLVGSLIHVYAVGYMRQDPGFSRFFLYFHFFLLSMLGLIVANNYLQLYVFWEGVGVASYLLIGFWSDRETARRAALKAFFTNRVGDACFLLGVFLLLDGAGTVRFTELFARLDGMSPARLEAAAFLLFAGACAKSAQFPLHVWLPDAMEGPTPTSALMHAATMVTAGVFLMLRSWPLLERAPRVLALIACVGAATAVGAAVVACVKRDLKRVLAYSTVSHLGLMMLAVGCRDAIAALSHLLMHGFFKALLFLGAGIVLHSIGKSSATFDEVGGLKKHLPVTFWSVAVGCASLAGLPPFSGFFSKDAILEAAFKTSPWLGAAGLAVAVGSAWYIGRFLFLTFLGPGPDQKAPAHPHAPGPWMELPVAALAVGAAALGALVLPTGVLRRLALTAPLWSGTPFAEGHFDPTLAGAALGGALIGLLAAAALYKRDGGWDWRWRRSRPGLESFIDSEFGWARAPQALAAAPTAALASFTALSWDARTLDRFFEAAANACVGLGEGLTGLGRGLLNEYLWWLAAGAAVLMLSLTWVR